MVMTRFYTWMDPQTNLHNSGHQLVLVGGLEHFLFSHILGIIIPIDFHIFQRGSNHQPVYVCCEGKWQSGRDCALFLSHKQHAMSVPGAYQSVLRMNYDVFTVTSLDAEESGNHSLIDR